MGIPLDYITTKYQNLPNTIGGYTVATADGFFTICLNQNHSYEKNQKTYKHELDHIMNGDFDKNIPVNEMELKAHNQYFLPTTTIYGRDSP